MNTLTIILLVIVGASLLCAVLVISATILSGRIAQDSSNSAPKEIKAKRLIPKSFKAKDPQEC